MENCFGKVSFLLYNDVMVAKYEILYNENDTEDHNKMFAFEIVSYFTKQINKEAK